MEQYIKKSAVIAEMERRISVLKANESVISMLSGGMFVNEFKDLLSFLDTLEVKEVDEEPVSNDLEAEFVLYLKHKFNIPQEGNTLKTNGWNPSPYDILDIAKHFAQWQKEQTIEKACEWLSKVSIEDMHYQYNDFDTSEGWYKFIEDFKNYMKGE